MKASFIYSLKKSSHTILLIVAVFLSLNTYAGDIEVSGLLTNRTVTWFGQDFFAQFSSEWRNASIKGAQSLVIEEQPSARRGTQIIILYKREIIFQTSISGTRQQSRERGTQAAKYVLEKVRNIDRSANRQLYADLASDEF